jgi:hypothetical protein
MTGGEVALPAAAEGETDLGAGVRDSGFLGTVAVATRRPLAFFAAFAGALVGFRAFAFRAFAVALACLRAALAVFLACFRALRACLNWAFARRARLRAASTCLSAAAATAPRLTLALEFGFLVVFIVQFLICRRRAPPQTSRQRPAPSRNQPEALTLSQAAQASNCYICAGGGLQARLIQNRQVRSNCRTL